MVRLFLCDDNDEYRTLVRMVLERAGHEVIGEAADGRQAVERAAGCAPEVVLLDLNMPGIGGLEALASLREALPRTRIFVLTTSDAPRDRESARRRGADGYIVKPTRVFALPGELRAALDGGRGFDR